ncbi:MULTISPECIES: MATE family efflux transporter [Vibrio]|uniref:Multidrug resistance protein NorM n=3 Tax=Vibrio natriegens TaxID=691 RepID=A0AAN0Y7A8_VIBNA|nr:MULTISPECIES: MATE family efflux transporter [Vibrio]ALR17850.1 Fis family transcriptional regulator [Vibrio natriegens NBRC 15636 = ATCC 14048 = DSM 759]ANQ15342.1 MATE family efflux transporter [Vibrio natriegens NBRC 15636 = ATCC 14048 = DSM 759]MDX6029305.1 MATE family efflux transporter [Vibrio natriegens NBRC 15636 = ATCC 14048 = DSM 759]UUI13992.1 MATE family efflux transporter [Vibrio natriegens]WRS51200.1 MATE family efflux transporter [Vibrio natriegens NBRC 15636 = ATCC 14048 = D
MSSTTISPQPTLAKQLFSMTWPMLFGVLSLMSFQLVDSAFIGQLGVLPLAVQGFTLPLQMVVIGIQVGLGIATTAVISKALGANETRYAKQLGGLVLMIGSVGVAIISVLIWLLRYPILSMLSAPDTVMPIIDSYWPWWLLSSWTGALLYFYYSICRAHGNTMLPGTMMMITSGVNLVLDPIFIFTFDLGINGAALATIVAFSFGILVVAPRVKKSHWATTQWQDLNVVKSVRSIGNIMGPAMISQLLPPLSSMLATKLLAGFGTAAVAAWALGSRFEFFAIVSVLALTMSLPPMVGRLLGAKNYDDIQSLVSIAVKFVLIFQLLIAVITFAVANPLALLMTSDIQVEQVLEMHLMIVPISLGSLGVCMLMVSICNALGKSYTALTVSALRLFVFFLPCLWVGSQLGGIRGLLLGACLGNICAGIAAYLTYRRTIASLSERHKAY